MITNRNLLTLAIVAVSAIILSSCGITSTKKTVEFSNDNQTVDQITPYVDQLADKPVKITDTKKLNEEFTIKYKTYNPDGEGTATFKAKSLNEINSAGNVVPEDGKKLIMVEIAVRGNKNNKGSPSTFDQVGDTPSPQFVLVDQNNNKSYVEETDFSGAYTDAKSLYALSKITLDGEQWVNTAIVFQIDKNLTPDLTLRFVNLNGDTEFYAISQ
jgi:hypothetical protein